MSGRGRWAPGVWRELVADAFRNLRAAGQRSLLALLGIVIGTAAVIAMIAIGHNAQQQSVRQFMAMGIDILAVRKDFVPSGAVFALTAEDVAALARLPSIADAAPLAVAGVEIPRTGTRLMLPIAGVTPDMFRLARLTAAAGRPLGTADAALTVAVLGAEAARLLGTAPGGTVALGRYRYTVVGILAPVVPNPLLPVDLNGAVLIPQPGMKRLAAGLGADGEIATIILRKAPGAEDSIAAAAVAAHFAASPRPRPVHIQTARQLIAAQAEQMTVYTALLSAIGGISLIVGGVGVMNVMLMNVVERRREIGLRLALGARPRDIRAMVLVESAALSLTGGGIGTALGVAAAAVYARTAGWDVVLPAVAVPLGLGMSVAVGLLSGLYPAVSASRLDPIASLRGE